MKVQTHPSSGKRGNIVAFKSRYGQVERQHVVPRKRCTPAQRIVRNDFGRSSGGWGTLTDEQRDAWDARAKRIRSRPRGGQSGRLTGQVLYTTVNRNQALLGLPPLVWPPECPALGPSPIREFTITRDGKDIALKLRVPKLPDGYILVYASASYSPGRRYCDEFLYLGTMPAPNQAESDITSMYLKAFGAPPPNTRVFIRTLQQVDGWRGTPSQTSALVPAK